jgi:hypothetical protein
MRSNLLRLGIACLFLPLLSIQANEMIPLPVTTLSSKADLVLEGRVVSSTVQRDPQGRIYTKIDLQVAEVWKGNLGTNHFTIVHGGGVLGEERATVTGQVEYSIGEEVVTFLVLNQRGEGVTIGLCQGKFHVWQNTVTGEKMVNNPFHGQPQSSLSNPKATKQLTLSTLKQRVTEAAK